MPKKSNDKKVNEENKDWMLQIWKEIMQKYQGYNFRRKFLIL